MHIRNKRTRATANHEAGMPYRSSPQPRTEHRNLNRHVSLITQTTLSLCFPAFSPLISQGLIRLWGFFSLGAAKCQKLIMRFMSHLHYNYTKMKHCKPLKDHQLTLGLPTSLWLLRAFTSQSKQGQSHYDPPDKEEKIRLSNLCHRNRMGKGALFWRLDLLTVLYPLILPQETQGGCGL